VDPETREEFEKQQASSPLAGLTGGNPTGSFDMASWMAGKKDDAPPVAPAQAAGKQGGGNGGGGKARRR